MEMRVQAGAVTDSEVRLLEAVTVTWSNRSCEAYEFTLARKVAKYVKRDPYRKPTQVDEERILR